MKIAALEAPEESPMAQAGSGEGKKGTLLMR